MFSNRQSSVLPRTPAQQRRLVSDLREDIAGGRHDGFRVRVVNRVERDAIAAQLTPIEQRLIGFTFETVRPDIRDGEFQDTTLDDLPPQ